MPCFLNARNRLYSLSLMSHHAERISLSIVRGVNRAIRSHLATACLHVLRAREPP